MRWHVVVCLSLTGLLVVLVEDGLAREEEDAGHGRGDSSPERLDGELRHLVRRRLGGAEAVLDHVRLEHGSLEVDVVEGEGAELRDEHPLGDLGADLDGVIAVGDDLRLDNRAELVALADGGVLREVLNAHLDGEVRRDVLLGVDLKDVAPLGEARALGVGLLAPLLQVVNPLAPRLGVAERAGGRAHEARLVVALVELDARDHAVLVDDVDHLSARRVGLVERLRVQDHARDVLGQPGSLVEHRSVRRAVLRGVRDLRRVRIARAQPRARRLVGREKTLPRRAERLRRRVQLLHRAADHRRHRERALVRVNHYEAIRPSLGVDTTGGDATRGAVTCPRETRRRPGRRRQARRRSERAPAQTRVSPVVGPRSRTFAPKTEVSAHQRATRLHAHGEPPAARARARRPPRRRAPFTISAAAPRRCRLPG